MNWMTSGRHRALKTRRGRRQRRPARVEAFPPHVTGGRPSQHGAATGALASNNLRRHRPDPDDETPWYILSVFDANESLDVRRLEFSREVATATMPTTMVATTDKGADSAPTEKIPDSGRMDGGSTASMPPRNSSVTEANKHSNQGQANAVAAGPRRCDFTPVKGRKSVISVPAGRKKHLPSPPGNNVLMFNEGENLTSARPHGQLGPVVEQPTAPSHSRDDADLELELVRHQNDSNYESSKGNHHERDFTLSRGVKKPPRLHTSQKSTNEKLSFYDTDSSDDSTVGFDQPQQNHRNTERRPIRIADLDERRGPKLTTRYDPIMDSPSEGSLGQSPETRRQETHCSQVLRATPLDQSLSHPRLPDSIVPNEGVIPPPLAKLPSSSLSTCSRFTDKTWSTRPGFQAGAVVPSRHTTLPSPPQDLVSNPPNLSGELQLSTRLASDLSPSPPRCFENRSNSSQGSLDLPPPMNWQKLAFGPQRSVQGSMIEVIQSLPQEPMRLQPPEPPRSSSKFSPPQVPAWVMSSRTRKILNGVTNGNEMTAVARKPTSDQSMAEVAVYMYTLVQCYRTNETPPSMTSPASALSDTLEDRFVELPE